MDHFSIKKFFRESGAVLGASYIVGFITWNFYLKNFGFFEFDLLQTRFLSAGFIVLLIPIVACAAWTRLYQSLLRLNSHILILIGFTWILIFAYTIFPLIPENFGGAQPSVVSIVGNQDLTDAFSSMNLLETSGTESIPGCKVYENSNFIIIGFASRVSKDPINNIVVAHGVRVLQISKNQIVAVSVLPQDNNEFKKDLCNTIRGTFGAGSLQNLFTEHSNLYEIVH